ncbi:hypothetical protein FB446DRAFT_707498 [Lentinula raphanica]|nr:hypothetical protein FB446DRAFT_707498 [Lentinula raphanica]
MQIDDINGCIRGKGLWRWEHPSGPSLSTQEVHTSFPLIIDLLVKFLISSLVLVTLHEITKCHRREMESCQQLQLVQRIRRSPASSSGEFELNPSLDRSTGKRQEGKPSSPTENWEGRVGELFTFKRDKRGISVTYGKELEDFAKERHARVALRVGGQPLGKITFKSRTAMKESSGRVTKDLGTSYGQRRGLLFITHGIDLLEKEKDVTVEMDREYYVLVREMLRIKGGGDGYVLSESDHATRAFYADMEDEELVVGKSSADPTPAASQQALKASLVTEADNKEKRLSHRTKSGKGKWENCLLSQFERVLKGIFVTYGKELEDFAKERQAKVGLRAGGQLLEKDVKVEMDRKYSVLVRDMLRKMGTGDGHEVPESDTAWRYLYADMEAGLTLMLDWGWSEEDLALMRSLVASQVAQSEKE